MCLTRTVLPSVPCDKPAPLPYYALRLETTQAKSSHWIVVKVRSMFPNEHTVEKDC